VGRTDYTIHLHDGNGTLIGNMWVHSSSFLHTGQMLPHKCHLCRLGVLERVLVWVLVPVLVQVLAHSIFGSHVPTSLLERWTDRKLCSHPA